MATTGKWLEWDAVAADAARALDRDRVPGLFESLDWFRLTAEHGIAPGPPLAIRTGDSWLFLARTGRRRAAPLASWYSLAFAPVGAPEDFPALFRTAAERLDVLSLHPVPDDKRAVVEEALREAGWRTYASRASTNWTIDLAGRDFSAYWAARPGALRSTVTRRRKSHPVDIAIFRRFDKEAWRAYEIVYAASWKPDEGSLPFLRDFAEREGAADTLRIGLATTPGGQTVAAQLWLVEHGVAIIHKLAHREDAKAGSPGSLLSAALFEEAIDRDRVDRIDFGLGDEPYKADWMEEARPVWRIDAYRPGSVRGLLGMTRERLTRLARRARSR
jgi:hypothetical protein